MNEETINNDKTRAEIASLIAETGRLIAETTRINQQNQNPLHHEKMLAEIERIHQQRTTSETQNEKLKKDLKWYEIVLIISGTVAFSALIVALTKAFL